MSAMTTWADDRARIHALVGERDKLKAEVERLREERDRYKRLFNQRGKDAADAGIRSSGCGRTRISGAIRRTNGGTTRTR